MSSTKLRLLRRIQGHADSDPVCPTLTYHSQQKSTDLGVKRSLGGILVKYGGELEQYFIMKFKWILYYSVYLQTVCVVFYLKCVLLELYESN